MQQAHIMITNHYLACELHDKVSAGKMGRHQHRILAVVINVTVTTHETS